MMNRSAARPRRLAIEAALCLIPAVWLGLLIGVSFVATPVKFTAPTLEYAPALDVGRVTFGLFSKVEWGVAALLLLATGIAGLPRLPSLGAAALGLLLAAQAIWLLPILDVRVAAVIAGQPLPPTWHHTAYGVLEAVKAALLLALAVIGARRLSGP